MKTFRGAIAATEPLLILPVALFMAALFLRNIQPQQYQPVHTAQLFVSCFTKRPAWLVLWVAADGAAIGGAPDRQATLARLESDAELRPADVGIARAHPATLLIAAATWRREGSWQLWRCTRSPIEGR